MSDVGKEAMQMDRRMKLAEAIDTNDGWVFISKGKASSADLKHLLVKDAAAKSRLGTGCCRGKQVKDASWEASKNKLRVGSQSGREAGLRKPAKQLATHYDDDELEIHENLGERRTMRTNNMIEDNG